MKFLQFTCFIILSTATLLNSASGKKAILKSRDWKDSLPTRQLLVVVADGWDNLQGRLYAYNKVGSKWIFQFSNPIVLGEKGLGLGEGLIPLTIDNVPSKKEGDMKAPAGIFSIGTAFGYATYEEATWINNSYIRCTDTLICVDDLHSINYNKLVRKDTAIKDYNSHEDMLMEKIYYKWGLFVNYNAAKPIKGNGSCIFIHIWGNDHEGTWGCTAMKEDDMVRILHWIKNPANPLLVQLPKTAYQKFYKQYDLPEINF
jgi:D-alanyl-D-alanine dipeptidase